MELRNKSGQVTHLADNLTLKEVRDMGFTIDLCDERTISKSTGKPKPNSAAVRKITLTNPDSSKPGTLARFFISTFATFNY
ncbi:hypothetical protein KW409_13620 [Vibrio fluvialis]|nr:hypothetical protein [Vibrio fluvialis]MBY7919922.1 hypothetical protein [Vibrio fluvialis]MBY8155494.1 hypothetical protein [Vibrio fluvialis]